MQGFLSTNNHQWSRIHLQRWKRKLRFVQCWNKAKMPKMSNHEMSTGTIFHPAGCNLASVGCELTQFDKRDNLSWLYRIVFEIKQLLTFSSWLQSCSSWLRSCSNWLRSWSSLQARFLQLIISDCICNQAVVNVFLGWHEGKLCSKTQGRTFTRAIRTTSSKNPAKISHHSKDSKRFGLFEAESWTTLERSSWGAL